MRIYHTCCTATRAQGLWYRICIFINSLIPWGYVRALPLGLYQCLNPTSEEATRIIRRRPRGVWWWWGCWVVVVVCVCGGSMWHAVYASCAFIIQDPRALSLVKTPVQKFKLSYISNVLRLEALNLSTESRLLNVVPVTVWFLFFW